MDAKKENILEILERELECKECPAYDTCTTSIDDCRNQLAQYLFHEEEDEEKKNEGKENPFDFLDSLMKDIESIHVVPVPMEDGHPVIVHIGEMEVIGFAKDVVEFAKQAGDKFAP